MKTYRVLFVGSQREVPIGTVKAKNKEDAGWKAHNKYNRSCKYDKLRVEILEA